MIRFGIGIFIIVSCCANGCDKPQAVARDESEQNISEPALQPLPDKDDRASGWDVGAGSQALYRCLAEQKQLPQLKEGPGWRLRDNARQRINFGNARIRLSCSIRYNSPASVRMNAALLEGDAQMMEEERQGGILNLTGRGADDEAIWCFSTGGTTPIAAVEDAELLIQERGMTATLQRRLQALFEFGFNDNAYSWKHLQTMSLDTNESSNLDRAAKYQAEAIKLRKEGDLANALLLADDSTLIVSAIYARHTCGS